MSRVKVSPQLNLEKIAHLAGASERRYVDGYLYTNAAQSDLDAALLQYDDTLHGLHIEQAKKELEQTDKDMARVAEDIINLLISKAVITENEIPAQAKEKMKRRTELRAVIG